MDKAPKKDELKEEFCPACVAVPVAFSSGISAKIADNYNINIWYIRILVTISFISISVFLYYMFIKKCDTCIS
jgi:hypothetical protein